MTRFRRARSIAQAPEDRCYWCGATAEGSPYRSPIVDIPGGRFLVCSPICPARPDGARVFSIGADWASPKEIA